MSVPDKSIDPRLLSAAKKVFLDKGFEMASLAELCQMAGVTTGALYKRYSSKEELFAEVVSGTIHEMKEYFSSLTEGDLSKLTDQELYDGFSMKAEDNLKWLRFLYDRKDEVILLIKCAAGTRYSNFHHDWSEATTRLLYKYYQEAKRRGLTSKEIPSTEMHVLAATVWTLYYEPFIHGFDWEQMEYHAETIQSFINWHRVFAMKKPDYDS